MSAGAGNAVPARKRVALVTGAARGIGLAAATALASEFTVVLLDRDETVTQQAANLTQLGSDALAIVADLATPGELRDAARRLDEELGGCDVLVNNAGIHPKPAGRITPLDAIGLDEWELVLRINLTAPFLLCQRVLVGMKERGWGRIVNLASRAGRTYSERAGAHYSASTAGIIGLTRKIAGDYAAFGITANCVAPGQISTPMARASRSDVLAAAARQTPVGRLGTEAEVAAAIRYLASNEAGFVTGAVLDVNGGAFMG